MDPRDAADAVRATTAAGDQLVLSLDGGHLLSWVCEGRERLFLSPLACWGGGRSWRGGVPVIFPQFGTFGTGARHGFARLRRWQPAEAPAGAVAAELVDDDASRAAWPHRFRLRVQAEASARALTITLSVHNTDNRPFEFTGALHSYLATDDLQAVELHGLQGRRYLDAAGGGRVPRVHDGGPLRFRAEVDRVYAGTDELLMSAPGGGLRIGAQAFTETVVWNPGPALAASMADLGAGQQSRFLCVEAAVVDTPVRLEPGAAWHGCQHLAVTGQAPGSHPSSNPSGDRQP